MKINSIIDRYSGPTPGGKRGEAAASSSEMPLEGFEPVIEAGDAKAMALREILSKYDVTDITPREFSAMLQEMHKEGLISDDLFKQLSLIRGELDRAGIDADDSIDLPAFYEKQLMTLRLNSTLAFGRTDESDADDSGTGISGTEAGGKKDVEERLGWLRKMAVAQDSADMVGLNAVA